MFALVLLEQRQAPIGKITCELLTTYLRFLITNLVWRGGYSVAAYRMGVFMLAKQAIQQIPIFNIYASLW